ncbi:MAG TPA: tyrosine-type recombinase/integrase [Solirubrobacteraceae bacterium]|nr:tyrosine-type recombinase/integrase [Solirubrobacteraceae bacterium]
MQEIIAVMREAGIDRNGARLRALIVVLWRGGLRIHEALTLSERDLDSQRGSLLASNGKGGHRRAIGMDAWGWEQLQPWLTARVELPVGPMFCVIDGRHAAGRGRVLRYEASFVASLLTPGSGAGSRRTS